MDIIQKIANQPGYGYVVNIDFIPLNEKQQQVERALELRQMDGISQTLGHRIMKLDNRKDKG